MLKRENLRPFLKPPTGIGRGHGQRSSGRRKSGGAVKMSPEDQSRIERLQEHIEQENRIIPSFIREGMSEKQIQEAIISEVRRTGETVAGIHPIEVDNRFAPAKDKNFTPLIQGLNDTPGSVAKTFAERDSRKIRERIEELTKNYSTKDLRRFVTEEIQTKGFRGGRPGYIFAIEGALYDRFNPRGITGISFPKKLGEPTFMVRSRAGDIRQAMDRRATYRSRIAEIQAKYKGGKK